MNLYFILNRIISCSIKIFILIFIFPFILQAQNDTIKYNVNWIGLASSGTYAPFWLQSNQFGKISSKPFSMDLFAGIEKDFNSTNNKFQYAFKANLLVQTDQQKTSVCFHELYAKAHYLVFDLTVGAKEEILGNQDSTLSSGGLLFSENSRPMPKITIGIEHFTPVPFTHGYLEIKGALTHGWFTDNIFAKGELLHHKYLYARIGGKLPVHFQYGLDHVVQWGGILPYFGQQPQSFKDYIGIFLGKSGGSDANVSDQINALGNHIISQSMRLDIDIKDFKIGAYWQDLNEDGPIRPIWSSMTVRDGLWGISIRNNKFPIIKGILYEYINTTDQSGPYHDRDGLIYGGNDNYFNNGIYQSGWSFFSRTIGTPLITSPLYNSNGNVDLQNNRVQAHHFGIEGNITGYNFKVLGTFSKNYGTYYVSLPDIKNTSLLFQVNKQFPKLMNINLSCSVGADFGNLFGNSVGCVISVKKTGDLFHY